MTQKMTEAAKLYWKDLDVLDQARSELVDYLDNVYEKWWERVRQLWQEDPLTSGRKLRDPGWGRKDPGYWSLQASDRNPTGVGIHVHDPRRLEAAGQYSVKLVVSKVGMRGLRRQGEFVLPKLGEVARQSVSDFSWDDLTSLSRESIELNPDDATDTAERLAGVIFEYLKVLVSLEEKLKELGSKA